MPPGRRHPEHLAIRARSLPPWPILAMDAPSATPGREINPLRGFRMVGRIPEAISPCCEYTRGLRYPPGWVATVEHTVEPASPFCQCASRPDRSIPPWE
jgi:hypothetical protein